TTGSCVRATALDAIQHNFYTVLVEECVFDRTPVTHAFNLFELDTRFADVLPLVEAEEYLKSLKQ
ncbi:MAG: isochorismatase family protein, partial [Candidatus Binatia bacterium]|nr:isochorismatase family protein [Candidatus Binatia bacterium]